MDRHNHRRDAEARRGKETKHCRDCVSEMLLLRARPDLLAEALEEMGISEANDNFPNE